MLVLPEPRAKRSEVMTWYAALILIYSAGVVVIVVCAIILDSQHTKEKDFEDHQ